jgi:hypothetical protein
VKTLKTLKKIPLFKELLTVLSAVVLLLLNSCAKDLSIGGDLVEGDKLNIKFTDTTTVRYTTEVLDSALAFNIGSVRTNLFLGNYNDPIFGKSNVEIIAELIAPSGTPNANIVSIDSVIFSLAYDSVNCVGDLSRNFTVELHRLRDSLPYGKIYTNRAAATQTLIKTASGANSYTFIPNTGDRRKPIASVDTTPLAYVNWKLDTAFGRLLFNIIATKGTTDFITDFKGLLLRGVGETPAVLSFNMLSQTASRMMVFYSYRDTTVKQAVYSLSFSNAVLYNYMQHDYTGKRVGDALRSVAKGDSAFYLQGLAGVNAKVAFPFAPNLGKVAINKAELEWTLDVTDASLPNISAIIIAERDSAGNFLLISDADDAAAFGGSVTDVAVNGRVVKKIKTNITKYYQSIVNGTGAKELYILPQSKLSTAGRTVIYGAKHTVYPAKLNVTYTKLD